MKGGKSKPDELKVIAGTFRKDRSNPNAPSVPSGIPEAPAWLSERASELFASLCVVLDSLNIVSPADECMIAMLASRLEEIEVLTATIEDQGRTYKGESGLWKARPEVSQRNEAMRHCHALLSEFGLSPATRNKVSANKPAEKNPFAALD